MKTGKVKNTHIPKRQAKIVNFSTRRTSNALEKVLKDLELLDQTLAAHWQSETKQIIGNPREDSSSDTSRGFSF